MQAFSVEGAGRREVNGIYALSSGLCDGASVYRKAGTFFALLRNGEGHWSLADMRGSSNNRWSLRTVELYRVVQIPAGHTPAPLGWQTVDGVEPAPMVHRAKSSLFTKLQEEKVKKAAEPLNRFYSTGVRPMSRAASEPRLPKLRTAKHSSNPVSVQMDLVVDRMKEKTRIFLNQVISFRVVLTRPSARIPWGIVWSDSAYRQSGSRIVERLHTGSPVQRWNVWQQVRGRTELCVQEGDQLVQMDGRWAYHEAEVGANDADEAHTTVATGETGESARCIVFEFLRPIIRPTAPAPPICQAWDTAQQLVVDWSISSDLQSQKVLGWALAVCDCENGFWYAIDGGSRVASLVGCGAADMGVLHPDMTLAHIWDGLPVGRMYAVCIAALTPRGWSPFSALSRPVILSKALNLVVDMVDPEFQPVDDWPTRPRFTVPTEVVPGATAPVEHCAGSGDFLSVLRRIRLKAVLGDMRGSLLRTVEFQQVGHGLALVVMYIEPGSVVERWNEEQAQKFGFNAHGAKIAPSLKPGDFLIRVNGVSGAAGMLTELRRAPKTLALTIERRCGGSKEEDAPPSDPFESLFPIDCRLDAEAVQAAESVQWNVLISPEEAVLAARIVECDSQALDMALRRVMMGKHDPPYTLRYPSILKDAERRQHIIRRTSQPSSAGGQPALGPPMPLAGVTLEVPDALSQALARPSSGDRAASAGGDAPPPMPPRRPGSGGARAVEDDKVLLGLRKAMADIACSGDSLRHAVRKFEKASHAVKSSQVGQKLLKRAQGLEALWRWQTDCAKARETLTKELGAVLRREAEVVANPKTETLDENPPHQLEALLRAITMSEPFGDELAFERAEGAEVANRLGLENERHLARWRIDKCANDPKEDEQALAAATDAAAALGVNAQVILAARELLKDWQVQHQKNALHDELFVSVKELRVHIGHRATPGAGSDEQRRVRIAIAGCGLTAEHPLVKEARELLVQWEGDNLALRAEARLQNAVDRALKGYSPEVPEAGDLLGSAIAEVSQQGVDAKYLEIARAALASWQASRLKRAEKDLEIAIEYKDQDFLSEGLIVARKAGVGQELVTRAARVLKKLQMEDEVNKIIEGAMESEDIEALESAVKYAHDNDFLEEENPMLQSGFLQFWLRFWTKEFEDMKRTGNTDGLPREVEAAHELMRECDRALFMLGEPGVPEVAKRTLERDMRMLKLLIPTAQVRAIVRVAEDELKRVLGAVERYAADLPKVIADGADAIKHGLDKSMVEEARQHLERYENAVKDLTALVSEEVPGQVPRMEDLKSALIKARLAGAPQELVDKAFEMLQKFDPVLYNNTQLELELLVALREADDISELPAEGRFMKVQDAWDAVKSTRGLEVAEEIETEVEDISVALAAERTLVVEITEVQRTLSGKDAADEAKARQLIDRVKRACTGADASAQEEAKRMLLPLAEQLTERLEDSVGSKASLRKDLEVAVKTRGTSIVDLRGAIVAAREGFLPFRVMEDAHAKLRKKRLEHLPNHMKAALRNQNMALAAAFWLRGVALNAKEERNGQDWHMEFQTFSGATLQQCGTLVGGNFTDERAGGSFGTRTWRQNPYYIIRRKAEIDARQVYGTTMTLTETMQSTKVTVYLAEGGPSPATMDVHAVRNSEFATSAGCASVLVPGYEVLAGSEKNDEIPVCSFQLPFENDDARPIFIVPSAAHGERGPFYLVVDASEPVEVLEVSDAPGATWRAEKTLDVEWKAQRPFSTYMGGGRKRGMAPPLSWYCNQQFRVLLKRGNEEPEESKKPDGEEEEVQIGQAGPLALAMGDTGRVGPAAEAAEAVGDDDNDEVWDVEEEAAGEGGSGEQVQSSLPPDVEYRLAQIFGQCDTQGTGYISKRDLIKVVRKDSVVARFFDLPATIRQEDGSRDKMEGLFNKIVTGANGEVSWKHFHKFYAEHVMKKEVESDSEGEDEDPSRKMSKEGVRITTGNPLLFARLIPMDGTIASPAAVHLVRNRPLADKGTPQPRRRVAQNPGLHDVVAASGTLDEEYTSASEVGTVCALMPGPDGGVFVVPSLQSKHLEGRYRLELLCTEDFDVELM